MGIELVVGDITMVAVDAIVNAANSRLAGGTGVNGAIQRVGGPSIMAECQQLRQERYPNGLSVGQAVATTAGDLPARWVIHTVGPIYDAGVDQSGLLAQAYSSCLQVADSLGAGSVSFPAISTGVYGYPVDEAAQIAVSAVVAELPRVNVERVVFVLFSDSQFRLYQRALAALSA